MVNQKGVIHLLPLLLIVALVGAGILVYLGVIKLPSESLPPAEKKEPIVSLQNQYKNPFDKDAQYLNPFSQYKNPFDTLKQAK